MFGAGSQDIIGRPKSDDVPESRAPEKSLRGEFNIMYKTGYYGSPHRVTKVHIVKAKEGPICGAKIGIDLSFQWCADGVVWNYVECQSCKRKVRTDGNFPVQAIKKGGCL